MKDRVPVNPGRVLITPENGAAAFYATMTRADNPTQEGDPLNKNTLLKDATAALFGLGTDAVPDDVLALLKTLVDNAQNSADSKAKIETGSYTGNGQYQTANPNTLTFSFVPKIIFVQGESNSNNRNAGFAVLIPENPNGSMHDLASAGILVVSIENTTVSWHATTTIGSNGTTGDRGPGTRLNISGRKYYYVAFG